MTIKKQHLIISTIIAFFLVFSFSAIHSHAAISDICGNNTNNECTFNDFKKIIATFTVKMVTIILPLMVLFIGYKAVMAWKSAVEGNTNAYKTATKETGQALLGFVLIVAVAGGAVIVVLKYFGVGDSFLRLISDSLITHTYAAGGTMLPNPLGIDDLYSFIIATVKTAITFFLYPAIVFIWGISGFMYVAARGNPEQITRAHRWLMWALITTIVIFLSNMFLLALQGTANKILSKNTSQQTTSTSQTGAGLTTGGNPSNTAQGNEQQQSTNNYNNQALEFNSNSNSQSLTLNDNQFSNYVYNSSQGNQTYNTNQTTYPQPSQVGGDLCAQYGITNNIETKREGNTSKTLPIKTTQGYSFSFSSGEKGFHGQLRNDYASGVQYVTVSKSKCDYNPNLEPLCAKQSGTPIIYFNVGGSSNFECTLEPNTMYYYNVRYATRDATTKAFTNTCAGTCTFMTF